jgi:L-threonylcarbamoyladenylate synthase
LTATRVVRLDQGAATTLQIKDIASDLNGGAVAAYPTETFYALGAAAFSPGAVRRIFKLKERDLSKPLSFIVPGLDMVRDLTSSLPSMFAALAGEFWPGPLTLVLPASAGLPEHLLGPGRTIAVRVPPLAWLRALVEELAGPLTATSANLAGQPELADPTEVTAFFKGRVDLVIDGGPAPGGLPSTIVDLAGASPRVLREGRIPAAQIEAVLRS